MDRVSALDSLHLDAFYEIALADEEDDQYRKRHNQSNCHHLTNFGGTHGGVQELKTDGYGEVLGGVQVDQRIEEVIPVVYQRHDADTHRNRLNGRKHDVCKGLKGGCSVNHGSFVQLLRERKEEQ